MLRKPQQSPGLLYDGREFPRDHAAAEPHGAVVSELLRGLLQRREFPRDHAAAEPHGAVVGEFFGNWPQRLWARFGRCHVRPPPQPGRNCPTEEADKLGGDEPWKLRAKNRGNDLGPLKGEALDVITEPNGPGANDTPSFAPGAAQRLSTVTAARRRAPVRRRRARPMVCR